MKIGRDDKKLTVRVNDDLTLDAGWWEKVPADDGTAQRLVHPPETTPLSSPLGQSFRFPLPVNRCKGSFGTRQSDCMAEELPETIT